MHNLDKGECNELRFRLGAVTNGYTVSIPIVTSPYDCIVDNGKQLLKVQIKSSKSPVPRKSGPPQYKLFLRKNFKGVKTAYAKEDVDVFAIYLEDDDTWYFFPFEFLEGAKYLSINPRSKRQSDYDAFRDNWDIFSNVW